MVRSDKSAFWRKWSPVAVGFLLGIVYWVLDSAVDALLFHERTLVGQIFEPGTKEVWIRVFALCLLVAMGFIVQITSAKQRGLEDELKRHRDDLDELVKNRTEELQTVIDQLQVNIAQRLEVEKILQESEERFRKIFEDGPLGMIIVSQDYRLVKANRSFCSMLGYDEEELVGRSPQDLTFPDDKEKSRDLSGQLLAGELPVFRIEKRYLRKNGEVIWADLTASAIRGDEGKILYALGMIEDITVRKQREREMAAVCSVSTSLRSALTRDDMLPVILGEVLDLLKVEGAALAMRDQVSGETVIELARRGWESWTGLRLPPGEGIAGHVISTGRPYVSNDVKSDPHLSRPDLIGDLCCVACVPLVTEELIIGALAVARKTAIADEELRLLTAIGEIAASAIHRSALQEQTEQHLKRLFALHDIDMAISSSLDLRLTLSILLPHVRTQLEVDAAAVLLMNPYSQTLEYGAGHGFRSRAIERTRIRLGEGHVGRAALDHQIVGIPNAVESEDMCDHVKAMREDAFVSHYAAPLVAKGQVKGVLEVFHRSPLRPKPDWMDYLSALAAQAAIAIDNAALFNDLQRSTVELSLAYDATIEGWSRALDLRDKETEGHSRRVTDVTVRIARAMGISEEELVHVRRGALLHDIGKMGIPDSILLKPGPLNDAEWEIMRRHPVFSYELLSPITFLRPALDIPYCHHEKWNGAGYPRGLEGEQIPLSAPIFAAVDVWDALASDRPYRPAWPKERIFDHMKAESGKHFDPKVVEAVLKLFGRD